MSLEACNDKELKEMTTSLQKEMDSLPLQNSNPSLFKEDGNDKIDWTSIPKFPRKINDLDQFSNSVLLYGEELDANHPGFKDEEYRKRRNLFVDIAYKYKQGTPIPRPDYTANENNTWRTVFRELKKLHPTHACNEYRRNFSLLEERSIYKEDAVPQLDDVSAFLKERTGFVLRPVAGFLSSRDFLAGIAFRVFYCTQYIRHSSDPFYTPEPDCCHELLGHVPLLADPSFARFSQELGLISLGASDADIKKLASCYVFTIEFGLCRQEGELRAYGAGLLSSIAELKHALTDAATRKVFKPEIAGEQDYNLTTYQACYFVSNSFEEAKQQLRTYARTLRRPFTLRYDPYTQSVDVLRTKQQINLVVSGLKDDLSVVMEALEQLGDRKA